MSFVLALHFFLRILVPSFLFCSCCCRCGCCISSHGFGLLFYMGFPMRNHVIPIAETFLAKVTNKGTVSILKGRTWSCGHWSTSRHSWPKTTSDSTSTRYHPPSSSYEATSTRNLH